MATLFIKNDELRRTAYVFRAFNVELAQIRDTTKTDELVQIKFQFWYDLINDIPNISNADSLKTESLMIKYKNFPIAYELFNVSLHNDSFHCHFYLIFFRCFTVKSYQNIGFLN